MVRIIKKIRHMTRYDIVHIRRHKKKELVGNFRNHGRQWMKGAGRRL